MRKVRCIEQEAIDRAQLRRQVAIQRLKGMREVHQRRLWLESTNTCEGFHGPCEITIGLEMVYPGPRYDWNGRGLNPNRSIRLCPVCSHDMQSHWAEMFADYYSSTGVAYVGPKDIYPDYDDPKITEHNLHILAGWKEISRVGIVVKSQSLAMMGVTS